MIDLKKTIIITIRIADNVENPYETYINKISKSNNRAYNYDGKKESRLIASEMQ